MKCDLKLTEETIYLIIHIFFSFDMILSFPFHLLGVSQTGKCHRIIDSANESINNS
jgi:hypothetical protein